MSEMKTVETEGDVAGFLSAVAPAQKAEDARLTLEMMSRLSGLPARLWGDSIIGFGSYNYTRADGSAHRFFRTGFSPRKANLTIYIIPGFEEYGDMLERLGPHKTSVSCLYITRLERVDLAVLEEIIAASLKDMARLYPA